MFGSLTFIWSEEPKPPSSRPRLPEKQAGRRVSEISSGLLPSGQLFKAFVGATLVHTAARRRLIFGLATPEWCDRLFQLESVGGRAHEAQYICFVWSGDGAAYRNGGVVTFSRYTFRQRHWQLKVLWPRSNRKTVRATSAHCKSERAACAIRLENKSTSGDAQQNARRILPATRNIGCWFTKFAK